MKQCCKCRLMTSSYIISAELHYCLDCSADLYEAGDTRFGAVAFVLGKRQEQEARYQRAMRGRP